MGAVACAPESAIMPATPRPDVMVTVYEAGSLAAMRQNSEAWDEVEDAGTSFAESAVQPAGVVMTPEVAVQ